MITRRGAAAGLGALMLARGVLAQEMPKPGKRDWAKEIPVMRIGLLGGENDADRLARVDGYKKLMEATFDVPVKLLVAADYAGVIQAFAAKQLESAYMSPAAYAAAWLESNGDVVPLVVTQEQDGSNSYVSVMYVRADSGIASLGEMKGHSLAWADPNSASGYLIPRAEFRAQGIDPEPGKYFSSTGFAGGHEQAVVAVLNHQYRRRRHLDVRPRRCGRGLHARQSAHDGRQEDARHEGPAHHLEVATDPEWAADGPEEYAGELSGRHAGIPSRAADSVSGHLPHLRHGQRQGLGASTTRRLPGVHRHAATGGGAAPTSVSAAASLEAAFQARRRTRVVGGLGGCVVLCVALLLAAWVSEAYPSSLIAGAPRIGEYFWKLLPDLRPAVLFASTDTQGSLAYWMYRIDIWLWLLFETSQMAALATLSGALLAALLCFPAAINLAPNCAVHFVFRRVLELFRSVPDIVYALILVWTFGVGPLAGILAIALHTVGALGKLFAEVVENADMRPWEAVRATGGTWAHGVRFAILPQVLPNFLSYVLLRFEINVRGATVIGFVGAGGIGQELYSVISFNYYQEIGAIIVLIILAVSLIDLTSEKLRTLAIGRVE